MAAKFGQPSNESPRGTGETQAPFTLIKSVEKRGVRRGNANVQAQLTHMQGPLARSMVLALTTG